MLSLGAEINWCQVTTSLGSVQVRIFMPKLQSFESLGGAEGGGRFEKSRREE